MPHSRVATTVGNQAVIGLDIGTSGIKAVAFSAAAEQLAKAKRPTPTRRYPGGRADYDAHELWAVCVEVLAELSGQLAAMGVSPVALSCTSMAESGVLLDRFGEPTYPVIPYFDHRSEPQIAWWKREIGVEATVAICGVVPHAMFGMPKLMWIRDNEPDAFDAGRTWLNLADYADYRLCGAMATDYSLASRTLVLDLARREWSSDLLEAIGIERSMLAELVPAGQVVGEVHEGASSVTGLPVGLPVVRGGQDHVCASVALGVTEPGVLLDSIGTAEALFTVLDEPDMSGRLWPLELNQGVHVVPDRYYMMTGTRDGGGRIDALRRKLDLGWPEFMAAAEQPGAERNVIESLARDGQELVEQMLWAIGAPDAVHLATGGGTRNSLLMKRKREIGGRPIDVPALDEATCLGAALLAGSAFGIFDETSRFSPEA